MKLFLHQRAPRGKSLSSRGFFSICRPATFQSSVFIPSKRLYSSEKTNQTIRSQHRSQQTPSIDEFAQSTPTVARKPIAKHTAYIALGSNLGDRIGMIEKACNEMTTRGIKIKRTSGLWETEPMYVIEQDKFINGACEVC
jgi:hypothetical protein